MAAALAVGMLSMYLTQFAYWTPACTFEVPALLVSHSPACIAVKSEGHPP